MCLPITSEVEVPSVQRDARSRLRRRPQARFNKFRVLQAPRREHLHKQRRAGIKQSFRGARLLLTLIFDRGRSSLKSRLFQRNDVKNTEIPGDAARRRFWERACIRPFYLLVTGNNNGM